ncbi:hypothetical protein AB0M43_25680 [Longispora sp. NPDC051575]|uniref:hypothetical protein n=1 Tax=Longispora sp. NPDC051575 TaxID=3154943 RepID=UPI003413E611
MDEHDQEATEIVRFPGFTAPVRPRSFMARVIREAARQSWREHEQGYSDEPWTLGRLGDLLWWHSPGSHEGIRELVSGTFASAAHSHNLPATLTGLDLAYLVYYCGVLKPLLSSWPDSREELTAELDFIRVALAYDGPDQDTIHYEIRQNVLYYLDAPEDVEKIRLDNPDIAELIAPSG